MNLKKLITGGFLLASICIIPASARTSLPPVFENDNRSVRTDELTRRYLPCQKVMWISDSAQVTGTDVLTSLSTGQADIASEPYCGMKTGPEGRPVSVILDFGKEIHGSFRLILGHSDSGAPARLRVRFGESLGEANAEPDGGTNTLGLATNDHAMRDVTVEAPRYGHIETGNSGFRFVRIDLLSPARSIQIKEAAAVMRYRDIPYVGSFRCSDSRLDRIWMTGAYTVHLNMQEYLWDGIKRDRLVWLGDMHPEVSTIMSVFGADSVVPRSLDLACRQYPLPRWINDISTYSLWYLIIQHDWFMHGGDIAFLTRHKDYITGLIDRIESRVDRDGTEHIEDGTVTQLTRFLDWPSSPDKAGVEAGYRAMVAWAMECASELCVQLGDSERAVKAKDIASRIRRKTLPLGNLKQAAALMAIAGLTDPVSADRNVLSRDGAAGFSTFYGYYMLEAMALAGNHRGALDVIRRYWGGMLDLGATTFWEDFNIDWLENAARIDEFTPEGKIDVHGRYGDYCYLSYRHSLCHGWASGPTAWLTRHILGVNVTEPGCRTITVSPNLGDLEWAEGTYPTPFGPVTLRHERRPDGSIKSQVDAPSQVRIILHKQ